MSIIRSPRPVSNFYQLDKSISEDTRLSWSARGVLIYLLGKPDDWKVAVSHLIKQTKQTAKHSGRDAIYAILAELEGAGYIQKQSRRSDGASDKIRRGGFCGIDYKVSEAGAPASSPPDQNFPDTAKPDTANPTQVSIDYKQRLKKKQIPKKTTRSASSYSTQKHIPKISPNVSPQERRTKNVVEKI